MRWLAQGLAGDTGSGNCDTAPDPASVLFSYASSRSQGRSWTKWCNGQYPGHFRGLGRAGPFSSVPGRSSSPLHTHSGPGVQPSVHTWATFSNPHPWREPAVHSSWLGIYYRFLSKIRTRGSAGFQGSPATLWDLMSPFIKQGC